MTQNTSIQIKQEGKTLYSIYLEPSFHKLPALLKELDCENKKLCVVTDSKVESLYKEELLKEIEGACKEVTLFSFPEGEASKTLETVQNLYEHLIQTHYDRKDMLIALGGGVTGDLTGYAAATYLRGIDFIQIPTTLLSQVDSSIGGKTGVDFKNYKNMIGAFHQPKLVYMNLTVLHTLPDRQFFSGMGEILKHGLIQSEPYYEWVITHLEEIMAKDYDTLQAMIYESCKIKGRIVEKDPTEQNERALLNFGHTIGHAIEKLSDFSLTHGECVALGCVAAAFISMQREILSIEEFFELRDMFVGFSLPITIDGLDPEEILAATKSDKKMKDGKIKFILLRAIGSAFIEENVTDKEILSAIRFLKSEEGDIS